jgi:mono/diheme cytochrome c family protein
MKTLTLLAIFLASTASAQDVAQGRDVFQNHCATCHGTGARGNGPMADVLSVVPADLTTLAASNGGEFPTARVVRRVDGQREVLAHGGPMPLWGMILDGPSSVIVAPDGAEIVAPEAIVDVAAWLATVQR